MSEHTFGQPRALGVGAFGEVGNRVFVLQITGDLETLTLKAEKTQLAALAEWLGSVVKSGGRPGHLPEDFAVTLPYDIAFVIGDIAVAHDEDDNVIDVRITSADESDETSFTLTPEVAGGLAIAITRAVEAGRPPCPLCGGPLDPRGHDCPRTNGFRPPIR